MMRFESKYKIGDIVHLNMSNEYLGYIFLQKNEYSYEGQYLVELINKKSGCLLDTHTLKMYNCDYIPKHTQTYWSIDDKDILKLHKSTMLKKELEFENEKIIFRIKYNLTEIQLNNLLAMLDSNNLSDIELACEIIENLKNK